VNKARLDPVDSKDPLALLVCQADQDSKVQKECLEKMAEISSRVALAKKAKRDSRENVEILDPMDLWVNPVMMVYPVFGVPKELQEWLEIQGSKVSRDLLAPLSKVRMVFKDLLDVQVYLEFLEILVDQVMLDVSVILVCLVYVGIPACLAFEDLWEKRVKMVFLELMGVRVYPESMDFKEIRVWLE